MSKVTKLYNMVMIASWVLSPFPVINGNDVRKMIVPDEITTEKKVVPTSKIFVEENAVNKNSVEEKADDGLGM